MLAASPWCAEPDCPAPASDIDHIVPLGTWTGDPYDVANLQPLCHRCHARKTAGEAFGR